MLFDLLYDEDIIREDVFWKWKDDKREDGHAISALSLKGFFEWLNEADQEWSVEHKSLSVYHVPYIQINK